MFALLLSSVISALFLAYAFLLLCVLLFILVCAYFADEGNRRLHSFVRLLALPLSLFVL